MIKTMEDIVEIIKSGQDIRDYGNIFTREKDELILLCYKPSMIFKDDWNYLEKVSRGLIINKVTGEVVARPFDKFFNWGPNCTDAKIKNVYHKLDGSLGIHYRYKGKHSIATKGSFDSEQAHWATKWLRENIKTELIPYDLTLMFEIIYPANRVVIDYDDFEGLTLLAARNIKNGIYVNHLTLTKLSSILEVGIVDNVPGKFEAKYINYTVSEELAYHQEGFVVEFEDGQRFKFKNAKYRLLHRIINNPTVENIMRYYEQYGLDGLKYINHDSVVSKVQNSIKVIEERLKRKFSKLPKTNRKKFALSIKDEPYQAVLFKMLDDRDYSDLLCKLVIKELNSTLNIEKRVLTE